MATYTFSLVKPPEDYQPSTRESAIKRQAKLERDKKAYFKKGGKITVIETPTLH